MIMIEDPVRQLPPSAVKAIRKEAVADLRRTVDALKDVVPSHWGPGRAELEAEHFADPVTVASLIELRVRFTRATFLLKDLAGFDEEGRWREHEEIRVDAIEKVG